MQPWMENNYFLLQQESLVILPFTPSSFYFSALLFQEMHYLKTKLSGANSIFNPNHKLYESAPVPFLKILL